jgi:hypothetical protein
MRSAQILAGAVVIAGLAIGPAFADQHGHPANTPHGNPHATPTPTTATAPTHGSPRTATPTTTTRTHGKPHTTTATTTTTAPMNPIAAKISSHPQQAARIERMLPAGMTLNQASLGFRNQGQFIAALHVSQNLHIPFADLKRAMTGPNAMSLGQAIHTLRPSANAGAAVRRANTQTHSDVH